MQTLTEDSSLVEMKGIAKYFGGFQALNNVDFQARSGEAVGIVGPNGAGKTTLFSVLAGVLIPSSGEVCYQGEQITHNSAASRCHMGIARTHQIPRPFLGMSVFENVLTAAVYGSGKEKNQAEYLAVQALKRTQMLALANRPAATLGLMDRKRLELARALATDPKVLLLDEIGGGLTEGELHQLVEGVGLLKQDGLTIVWIEHILHALLKVIDRLVCMDTGSVIAQGTPQDVMANDKVIQAYLGSGGLS
jgi:branched-chain amino acid transport system ATP-binding protein